MLHLRGCVVRIFIFCANYWSVILLCEIFGVGEVNEMEQMLLWMVDGGAVVGMCVLGIVNGWVNREEKI